MLESTVPVPVRLRSHAATMYSKCTRTLRVYIISIRANPITTLHIPAVQLCDCSMCRNYIFPLLYCTVHSTRLIADCNHKNWPAQRKTRRLWLSRTADTNTQWTHAAATSRRTRDETRRVALRGLCAPFKSERISFARTKCSIRIVYLCARLDRSVAAVTDDRLQSSH